jgi:hypothetical protein
MTRLATTIGALVFLVAAPPVLALGCTESFGDGEPFAQQDQPLGTPVTITVTTPPAVAPTVAVLNATGSITVGAVASVTGTTVQLSSAGDVSISPEVTLQDVWAEGAALVGSLTHINGTLHAATTVIDPSAVIAHTDMNPVFSPLNTLSWTANIPSGTTNVHVTSGQATPVMPGAYATVQADTGATLKLQAGTYYVGTLTVSQGSKVSLDQSGGAVVVYVTGGITLNGTFTPVQSAPANLLVAYLGSGHVSVGGAAGAPFGGDIIAPNAQLSLLNAPSAHSGFFAAQNIQIDTDAQIVYSPPTAVVSASGMGSDAGTDGGDAGDSAADSGDGGDASDSGVSDGDAGDTGVIVTCTYDAGTAPKGPAVCGDGWRDPTTEECDDGLGMSTARRGCSSTCQVLDELAVAPNPNAGLTNSRTLGAGRHTVAVSTSTFGVTYLDPNALTLSLATFSAKGVAGAVTPFSGQSTVVQESNPVVAGLPCDQYAVAWTDYDTQGGNELNVALQIVTPGMAPTAAPTIVNQVTGFSQFDPDILWTGSELVVAWVDDSNPADSNILTAPDIRYATLDATGKILSGPLTLAATTHSEADVALAAFNGSWAAAWRDDVNGLETVQVVAGSSAWTVGPAFLPAPVSAKPSLVPLDATHLLVAYAVGVDDTDSGVANGSRLQVAVLSTTATGMVTGQAVAPTVSAATGLDQSQPSAINVNGNVYLAWWTAAALTDKNGEQLWLKNIGWNGMTPDLTKAEISLARWTQAQLGDQRLPGLAASTLPPGGAIVAAWDDLGRNIASGEGSGDVVVELAPAPVLRTGGTGGP